LTTNILEHMEQFKLNDLNFTTYVKQFDSGIQLSASDIVYAISAIIEYPRQVKNDFRVSESSSESKRDSKEVEEQN